MFLGFCVVSYFWIFFKDIADSSIDLIENILYRLTVIGTDTADVSLARLHIKFYARQSCAILPTVMLFFQHQIHFIDTIKRRSVFLFIVF